MPAPEPLPRRGEPLPPHSGMLPQRSGMLGQNGAMLPDGGESLPQRGAGLPRRNGQVPADEAPLPRRGEALPQRGEALPQRGEALPQRGEALPQRGEALPQRGTGLPRRDGQVPAGEPQLPQRGQALAQRGEPLPRRTGRTRPAGRHRSPHRLSVASDAPALVIAVPGTAAADAADVGTDVAALAELSCPGVDIRVGYLDGVIHPISEALDSDPSVHPGCVIVPLLLSPNASADAALAAIAAQAGDRVIIGAHLAPHPLVAEALHARLADAGLARHARSSGLSIATGSRGVVVLSDTGEEAAAAASVAAVLLASRLSVPVVPASLGDPESIANAVIRLRESGAESPALSPCLIGPEFPQTVLDDLASALSAPSAAVLGAHPAVGQLVAIRYGAALARLSLAG
jgi:hypothetical protein